MESQRTPIPRRRPSPLPGFWASLAGLALSPVRAWLYVFRRPLLLAAVMLAAIMALRLHMTNVARDSLPGSASAAEAHALLHVHRDKVLAGLGDGPTVGRNYRVVGDDSGSLYHAIPISGNGASALPVFWMQLDQSTGEGSLGRAGSEVVVTMNGGSHGR